MWPNTRRNTQTWYVLDAEVLSSALITIRADNVSIATHLSSNEVIHCLEPIERRVAVVFVSTHSTSTPERPYYRTNRGVDGWMNSFVNHL
jgi:hypothetical protein